MNQRIITFLFFLCVFALIVSAVYNGYYTREIKRLNDNFYLKLAYDIVISGIVKQANETGGVNLQDSKGNVVLRLQLTK